MNHQNANNIMFSQVREDPQIEIYTIDKLNKKYPNNYLLIGSGGCTLFSILSTNQNNFHIDVLDKNIEQIYLIKLKLEIICYLKSCNQILDFFEGLLRPIEYDEILKNINLDDKCNEYWKNNINFIYKGINKSGVFELLFNDLIKTNYNFQSVFDRQNLIDKFGTDAVINSLNEEFYDHFKNIISKYQQGYDINDNYFYHQIIHNSYSRTCLPMYFNNIANIIKNKNNITFINEDFYDYMTQINTKYDFIHTSNLTDWMNKRKIYQLLFYLNNNLNTNGYVVFRKLNGDYNLSEMIPTYFIIDNNRPHETSEFYKETIVCYKN